MLLTKYKPSEDINNLYKIMNSLQNMEENKIISGFTPQVNIREGEFAYHIDVDLPGMKKKDITIDVRDNTLSVSGERNFKEEVKEEDYYKVESSFGKFERLFTLPDGIDIENISASSTNGVLEIVIPKLEKKEAKKTIEIQ